VRLISLCAYEVVEADSSSNQLEAALLDCTEHFENDSLEAAKRHAIMPWKRRQRCWALVQHTFPRGSTSW
jgi:hypothetical protein